MLKVVRYECKRLMWNKFFVGLGLVLLFYGWQVLNRVTIFGISHTAPFSPWSFGDFLCRMLPLLWIGTVFFLTFFFSGRAKRAAVLTDAAPMDPRQYALARCAAALLGSGGLVLVCLAEAAVFYVRYFGWHDWGELLLPAFLTLVPPLLFALGGGWQLGKVRSWLLYVWALPPLVCRILPLPEALGLWNGSFFPQYPLRLEVLDPAFSLPWEVLLAQGVMAMAGAALLAGSAGISPKRKKWT